MIPFLEPGLVRVLRVAPTGAVDRYGKPVTSETEIGVYDGRVEGKSSVEGEAFVVDTYQAFIEPGATVKAGDSVVARGVKYQVQGAPIFNTAPGLEDLAHWTALLKYVGPVA